MLTLAIWWIHRPGIYPFLTDTLAEQINQVLGTVLV